MRVHDGAIRDLQGNYLDSREPDHGYRAGGYYPIPRTADELRAGVGEFGPNPGEVGEINKVRVRVAIALAEIEERNAERAECAYLDDLKRQIEWMLSWQLPGPNFCNPAHLSAYLNDPSLMRAALRRAPEIDGDGIDANDCGPSF